MAVLLWVLAYLTDGKLLILALLMREFIRQVFDMKKSYYVKTDILGWLAYFVVVMTTAKSMGVF